MITDYGQINVNAYRPANLYGIHHINLYAHEETVADLVILPPGASIPLHRHDSAHEIFDVLDGMGAFTVAGRPVSGEQGKCVFVPSGTEHSMENTGDEPWVVRVTYQKQVYPRHFGRLVGRSVRKRLGLFYQ